MSLRILPLLLAALCLLGPGPAKAWWDQAWTFRKEITVDTAAAGSQLPDTVRRFPLLVRLDSAAFAFADADPSGKDLRFIAADDKTPLSFRIESYDPGAGLAMIWVELPELLPAGQTKLWLYFGNKDAAAAGTPARTYDPLYRAVYHFPGTTEDATANRTPLDGAAAFGTAGIAGRDLRLTGTAPLTIPAPAASITQPDGFTVEMWAKPQATPGDAILYALRNDAGTLTLGLAAGIPYAELQLPGVAPKRIASTGPLGSDWTHLAVTGTTSALILYVNGQAVATLAEAVPVLTGTAILGGAPAPLPAAPVTGTSAGSAPTTGSDPAAAPPAVIPGFVGEVDELRLSNTARSAAYFQAVRLSQGTGTPLLRFGADEELAAGGFGYFGVIWKNLTVDAVAIIIVLGIMAVISWIVMGAKSRYINRTVEADEYFQELFRERRGDLSTLSANEQSELRHSALFRIYRSGLAELLDRHAEEHNPHLSDEAVESIRGAIDAARVEETEGLDRWMVLLTIAIAGGPFIGLLGTVLGVMITFAAISLAGDVNVNAIAPGVAAALAATVAGLAVAIPALFGYNYLSTRANSVSNRLQVFSDRLVGRLAELHRRNGLGAIPQAGE